MTTVESQFVGKWITAGTSNRKTTHFVVGENDGVVTSACGKLVNGPRLPEQKDTQCMNCTKATKVPFPEFVPRNPMPDFLSAPTPKPQAYTVSRSVERVGHGKIIKINTPVLNGNGPIIHLNNQMAQRLLGDLQKVLSDG